MSEYDDARRAQNTAAPAVTTAPRPKRLGDKTKPRGDGPRPKKAGREENPSLEVVRSSLLNAQHAFDRAVAAKGEAAFWAWLRGQALPSHVARVEAGG
ncbi:MAG: hypothetical protein ABI867_30245 [Kofleriaceae bacterium]